MTIAQPIYTWENLLAVVPEPTDEQRALYAVLTDPDDLIESGTRIRSEKILTDLVHWGGQVAEFMPKATPAQKKLLLGYSEAFFRVAVHDGAKLRTMLASRGGNVDDRETKRAGLISAAAKSFAEGLDERDRLSNALVGLCAYDATLRERLDMAKGTVGDAAALTRALRALVELGRSLLADPKSTVAQQLAEGGVDEAELKLIEGVADEVSDSAANADGARAQGAVTQADLDLQDGICLAHMERLRKIFNGAHDRDPVVPNLVANATRRIFAPVKKKKAAVAVAAKGTVAPGATAPTAPATGTGTGKDKPN